MRELRARLRQAERLGIPIAAPETRQRASSAGRRLKPCRQTLLEQEVVEHASQLASGLGGRELGVEQEAG